MDKKERLEKINELLVVVASNGRNFLRSKKRWRDIKICH